MKYVILALIFALGAVSFVGATPSMPRDGEGQKIQAPSWDAALSQAVTSTSSQNIDITGKLWYEFVAAGDCKGRLMNTTTKATWPTFVLKANVSFRGSNDSLVSKANAVYLNVSGCTGDFRAQ